MPLLNHRDACHGMYFHPLRMKGILHARPYDPNVGAHGRELHLILVALTRRFCVRLRHRKPAHDLEHQIATLSAHVSGVQKVFKTAVDLEPPVRVSIRLVTDSVRLLACGRIDDRSGHRDALLFYDEALRMIDVIPQSGVTLIWRWRACYRLAATAPTSKR